MVMFEQFLEKSEQMRKGYRSSLCKSVSDWREKFESEIGTIPKLIEDIYSCCDGSKEEIENQALFDFIPGYRLMQSEDILSDYKSLKKEYPEIKEAAVFPFLKDYSGNYIAYAAVDGKEQIISITPEEGIEVMHDSVDKFWETILAFYDRQVYFLDEDGFLDYDFELEGKVGAEINEGVAYWD